MDQGLLGAPPHLFYHTMKKLCLLLCICMLGNAAWGKPHLRHARGSRSIALSGGRTALGYRVGGAYSAYRSRNGYWKLALSGAWRVQPQGNYQAVQFMPALGATLLEGNSVFYLNLLAGVAATYEGYQQGGNRQQGGNMAVVVGPTLACFFLPEFAILFSLLPCYYCFPNLYGHWGYAGSLGLQVTF